MEICRVSQVHIIFLGSKQSLSIQLYIYNFLLFRNHDVLSEESLANAQVLIVAEPRNKFTELEMNTIRGFINGGKNVLVMLGEGGENKLNTNINFLLEEFGIMVNNGKLLFVNSK